MTMSLLSLEHIFVDNKLRTLPFFESILSFIPASNFFFVCELISYIFTFRVHNSRITSITPAGVWLYLGLFELRLIITCAPAPGGERTLTSLQPPQGQSVFEHNHQQVSDLERSRSGVSSEPFVFSFTSPPFSHFIHAPTFWGRCSRRRSIQFPKFLTTLVSADSAIVKQMISLLCQNNPNLVERKGGRIKMTKGGGYFHLVINVQMSSKAESDTTF